MEDYGKLNAVHEVSERDPFTEDRYRQFFRFMKKGARHILDIGCNTGRGGRVLKHLNTQFVISGLDIVQERLDRLPKDVYQETICGSSTEIPASDGAFDAVLAGEFIEHLYPHDIDKTLAEIFRVLRIGGQVFLTTPNPKDVKRRLRGENILGGPHVSQHHPDLLKLKLRMIGFSRVRIYGSGQVSNYLGARFPLLCLTAVTWLWVPSNGFSFRQQMPIGSIPARSRFERRPKVLVSSFTCKAGGKSETYSGYKWLEQIARHCDTTLVTADDDAVSDQWRRIQTSRLFRFKNKLLKKLNGEIFFDYFWFNYQSKRQLRDSIRTYDLVHHVVPIAPRYPISLGCLARKFILGPIGGGLRAPESFRSEVEGHEEWFYKLRALDRARLDYDPFLRSTFDAADLILLVASYMYDVIPQRYHHKCQVMLETGIDSHDYKPTRPLSAKGSEPLKLLYASRIVPYKGLIYVLRALDRLPTEAKNKIRFTVVGDRGESGYEQACKDFVKTRGLEKMVTFLGFKPKGEILEYYDDADLFVFPSLAENSGNVVLEAMVMGRPVLAVRRGGPAEIVTPESGFLIDPRNPEYLVERIKEVLLEVLANRELIVAKGAGARKVVEDRFDWSKKGEALMRIYSEVLVENRIMSEPESVALRL